MSRAKELINEMMDEDLGEVQYTPRDAFSDDPSEEKDRKVFLKDVEKRLDDLIKFIRDGADRLGGEFKSPGIQFDAGKIFLKRFDMRRKSFK